MDSHFLDIAMSKDCPTRSPSDIKMQAIFSACVSIVMHLSLFALLGYAWVPTPPVMLHDASPRVLEARLVSATMRHEDYQVNTLTTPNTVTRPTIENASEFPRKMEKKFAVPQTIKASVQRDKHKSKRQEMKSPARRRPPAPSQRENQSSEKSRAIDDLQQSRSQVHVSQPITPEVVAIYRPIEKQAPEYPRRARERGIEGDCTVEYTITRNGTVERPTIVGKCHALFVQTSLAAARHFRYEPQTVNGQAQIVTGVKNTFRYRMAK